MTTTTTTATKPIPTRRERRAAKAPDPIAMRGPTITLDLGQSDVHVDGAPASVSWIQIARPGSFRGHSAGPFEMSAATFAEMIRNFHDVDGGRIPIDFEHASEAPASAGEIPTRGAPAQGWITALEMRDGDLWARVEWGEQARDYVRAGQYRYVSPAVRFGSKHPTSGKPIGARLSSVALTNQPFLGRGDRHGSNGLAPITARDASAVETARRIVRDDEKRRDDLLRRAGEQPDDGAEPKPKNKDERDEVIAALRAECARLRKELAKEKRARRDAETRNREIEADLSARDEEEITELVDGAIGVFRLTQSRDALLRLCRADRSAFLAAYPAPPAHQLYLAATIASGPHNVPAAVTMKDDAATTTPPTIDEQVASVVALAKSRGVSLSRDEAYATAHEQIRRMTTGGAPPR